MAEPIGHELVEACAACGEPAVGAVTQTVVGDRIAWAVSTRCPACGSAVEVDDWDAMPDLVRAALVARVGLVRLRATAGDRVALLEVFRKDGATIGEAVDAVRRLTGPGLTGTPAEMELLAGRLTAAGARVEREPYRG